VKILTVFIFQFFLSLLREGGDQKLRKLEPIAKRVSNIFELLDGFSVFKNGD
jgi:hypothetical protein